MSAPDPLRTRFCELVGCRYPIVQTGMGWVSGANLTAATSAAGGFGILAAVTMTPDQLRQAVAGVKDRTDAPFGVNFRADQPGLTDRLRFVTDEGVRMVSFAGAPTRDAIAMVHDAGALVVPTVGARRHAEKMLEWGVDAVIAQGGEGRRPHRHRAHVAAAPPGGRRGEHADPGPRGRWLPLGRRAGSRAGVRRRRHSHGHALPPHRRKPGARRDKGLYTSASVLDTVVTTALDGAPQRVIRTETVDGLERAPTLLKLPAALRRALAFRQQTGTPLRDLVREGLAMRQSQDLTWAQLAMAANAPMLIRAALVDGNASVGVLPTGQVTGVIDELPTVADLIAAIVDEARATLARLAG